jgi:hypothetical protein
VTLAGLAMDECKVDFNSLSWQSPTKGVRFKAFLHGNRRLRLVEFSDEFVELEWCMKGHIGYVLEGEGEIDFSGQIVKYSSGDGVFIQAGLEHKHKLKVLSKTIQMVLVEDI